MLADAIDDGELWGLYDLPERVLPASVLDAPTPTEAEARKELRAIAARSTASRADDGEFTEPLIEELRLMAGWLELDTVASAPACRSRARPVRVSRASTLSG